MFSVFSNLKPDASPEELYQLALEQKAKLSQQIEHLVKTRQAFITITQEDHLSMESQYNIWSSMLKALEVNIRELTDCHPRLLTASLPSGPITGDHFAGSSHSSFSSSAFSFANASASQLTFHPGVNTKGSSKQEKNINVSVKRR